MAGIASHRRFSRKGGLRFLAWLVVIGCFLLTYEAASYAGWSPTNGPYGGDITAVAVDPVNHSMVYAGTEDGKVFKSTDGGTVWFPVDTGLPGILVQCLVIDPVNRLTVYAGIYGRGVYKTADGGGNWSAVNTGLGIDAFIQSLAIDPTDHSTLYAATFGGGVFKTTSKGRSWSAVNKGLKNTYIYSLAIDPADHLSLYAGPDGGGDIQDHGRRGDVEHGECGVEKHVGLLSRY